MSWHLLAACCSALIVSAAVAQPFTPLDRPDPQLLWDRYRSSRWTPDSGAQMLARIAAAGGLPATPANAETLLARFRQSSETEERIWLQPLLSQLHQRTSDTGLRLRIEQALKDAAAAPSVELRARQSAIRTYANLGPADALEVLTQARKSGLLDDAAYHAELARLLPGAPARTQIELLGRIRGAGHELSVTIALSFLANDGTRDLPRNVLQEAAALLAAHPTRFTGPSDTVGVGTEIREDNWVRAWVMVHSMLEGRPERVLLGRHLLGVLDEPRRLLPLLASPERGSEVRAALDRATIAKIHAVLADHARRFPSAGVREAVTLARANLGP